ncbi:MAG TPA: hypothetical protein VJ835_06545 [Fimbriimonadaceae bacterium]|nr:hypothetical protein [Fimbriimonadaceae bacterium]
MTVEAAVPEIEMMMTEAADHPTVEETTTIAVGDLLLVDATMMTAEAGTAILEAIPRPHDAVGKIVMIAAAAEAVHPAVATTTMIAAEGALPEPAGTSMTIEVAEARREVATMTMVADGTATHVDIPKRLDAVGKIATTVAVQAHLVAETTTTAVEEALPEAAGTTTIAVGEAPHADAEMMKAEGGSATPVDIPKRLDVVGKIETTGAEARARLEAVHATKMTTIAVAEARREVATTMMVADGTATPVDIPKRLGAVGMIEMIAVEAEAVHPAVAMTMTIEEDEALLGAAETMTTVAVAVPPEAGMTTMDAVGMSMRKVTQKPLVRAGKAETAEARAMTTIAEGVAAAARLQ